MKKNLLTILLMGSIGTNCGSTINFVPSYRQVRVEDEKDRQNRKEIARLQRENDRLRRNGNNQVRQAPQPDFEWLTTSDKNMIKYGVFGVIIFMLITRRR